MNKKTFITMMLALVAMTGQAQTKTATVIGYSPALKDGTLVFAGTGSTVPVVDTVQAGRFAYILSPLTDEIRLVPSSHSGFLFKNILTESEMAHVQQSMK